MDIGTLIVRLIPVLGALALATIIETLVPLRQQSRGLHGRLATNLTLLGITLGLGMFFNFTLAMGAAYIQARGLGLLQVLGAGAVVSFVATVLALDGATYVVHRLLHRIPSLWRVHLVHHIDASVDATTAFRQHPARRTGALQLHRRNSLDSRRTTGRSGSLSTAGVAQCCAGARQHTSAPLARPDPGLCLGDAPHAQGSSFTGAHRDRLELRQSVLVLRSRVRQLYTQQSRHIGRVRHSRL